MTAHHDKSVEKIMHHHFYSRNKLEPDHLYSLFFNYLPQGFVQPALEAPLPAFVAQFNLLTTMDSKTRKRLERLPAFQWWQRFLTFKTLFIGTCVSEFTPLVASFDHDKAIKELLLSAKNNYPLVIVKDLPLQANPTALPSVVGDNLLLNSDDIKASNDFLHSLEAQGFLRVEGQALAFVALNFASLDDYLNRFSKSRRKDFRRKIRHRDTLDISILQSGDALFFDEATIDIFYQLYLQVYQQSDVHFDLLSRDFFKNLLQNDDPSLRVFVYKTKDGRLVGYNICFIYDNKLIDKYIGFDYRLAHDYNLYFLSWFINLEYGLQQKLDFYVAGWTDPEVKAYLGAQFTMTYHSVYIRNNLLRRILKYFRRYFENDATQLASQDHDSQIAKGTR